MRRLSQTFKYATQNLRPLLGYISLVLAGTLSLVPAPPTDNSVAAISSTQDDRARIYADFRKRFGADEVLVVHLKAKKLPDLLTAIEATESILLETSPIVHILGPTQLHEEALLLAEEPELLTAETRRKASRSFEGPIARNLTVLKLSPPSATIYAFAKLAEPAVWQELKLRLGQTQLTFADNNVTIIFGGSPFLNLALNEASHDVEQSSLPLLAIVCTLLLTITLRSPRLTICILIPVSLSVLSIDGLLTISGLSGNLIINVTKPLTFVILLASALHITVAFEHGLKHDLTRSEAAWKAAIDKTKGISLALLTTTIGFLSLCLANIAPIRNLGYLAATTLAEGSFLILFALPTLLAKLGPLKYNDRRPILDIERNLVRSVLWSMRWRQFLLGIVSIIIVLGFSTLPFLETTTQPIKYFPKQHPTRATHEYLANIGASLMTLEVLIRPHNGNINLSSLDKFAATATAIQGIRARLDVPLLLRERQWRTHGHDDLPLEPESRFLIDSLSSSELLLHNNQHRVSLLLHPSTDTHSLDIASTNLKRAQKTYLPDSELILTGNFNLMAQAQRSLQQTLLRSLALTLILMELVLVFALRSIRLALYALIPNILPIAFNLLAMWILDIPLDVGTAMTGAIALGIAVDDTLHFIVAWQDEGSISAIQRTGKALVLSTIVMTSGFFALLPSTFLPTRYFGLLVGSAMITALLSDLYILPLLLKNPLVYRHRRTFATRA